MGETIRPDSSGSPTGVCRRDFGVVSAGALTPSSGHAHVQWRVVLGGCQTKRASFCAAATAATCVPAVFDTTYASRFASAGKTHPLEHERVTVIFEGVNFAPVGKRQDPDRTGFHALPAGRPRT